MSFQQRAGCCAFLSVDYYQCALIDELRLYRLTFQSQHCTGSMITQSYHNRYGISKWGISRRYQITPSYSRAVTTLIFLKLYCAQYCNGTTILVVQVTFKIDLYFLSSLSIQQQVRPRLPLSVHLSYLSHQCRI